MKANLKLLTTALVMVGMVGNGATALAQTGGSESGAEQIIRVAGIQNVPEASLYLHEHGLQESGASQMARVTGDKAPTLALNYGWTAPIYNQATVAEASASAQTVSYVRLTGAQQIIRIAGVHMVPEASLYWDSYGLQESGASQMARITGAAPPEASLYLGGYGNDFNSVTIVMGPSSTTVN